MELINQLVEAWEINNRINIYLLSSIEEYKLELKAGGKGRSAGEQFAHLHNVRLMWLQSAAPELLAAVKKIEKEERLTKKFLAQNLEQSGKAIFSLLKASLEAGGKIKGFKPHAAAFAGYLTAHEAHHRGQIILTLKGNNVKLDKKVLYGMWEWGSR